MTPFNRNIRLHGIMVGELRARRIGPGGPSEMSRMCIIDDNYNPVGQVLFSAWSPRSRKLLEALCASIEDDLRTVMQIPDPTGEGSDTGQEGEDQDEGVEFP